MPLRARKVLASTRARKKGGRCDANRPVFTSEKSRFRAFWYSNHTRASSYTASVFDSDDRRPADPVASGRGGGGHGAHEKDDPWSAAAVLGRHGTFDNACSYGNNCPATKHGKKLMACKLKKIVAIYMTKAATTYATNILANGLKGSIKLAKTLHQISPTKYHCF